MVYQASPVHLVVFPLMAQVFPLMAQGHMIPMMDVENISTTQQYDSHDGCSKNYMFYCGEFCIK